MFLRTKMIFSISCQLSPGWGFPIQGGKHKGEYYNDFENHYIIIILIDISIDQLIGSITIIIDGLSI